VKLKTAFVRLAETMAVGSGEPEWRDDTDPSAAAGTQPEIDLPELRRRSPGLSHGSLSWPATNRGYHRATLALAIGDAFVLDLGYQHFHWLCRASGVDSLQDARRASPVRQVANVGRAALRVVGPSRAGREPTGLDASSLRGRGCGAPAGPRISSLPRDGNVLLVAMATPSPPTGGLIDTRA
jgi:hypothetical protein